jgi:anti-sigma regulatory factor (Ser/Thr protein kinase)
MDAWLTLPARMDALEQLEGFIVPHIDRLPTRARMQIVLAVHEVCMNIVQHGYDGETGTLELHVAHEGGQLVFTIRDHARNAYYPPAVLTHPEPESLPEHGWGIYIVHQVMDRVEYRHLAPGNEWHLIKQLPGEG